MEPIASSVTFRNLLPRVGMGGGAGPGVGTGGRAWGTAPGRNGAKGVAGFILLARGVVGHLFSLEAALLEEGG